MYSVYSNYLNPLVSAEIVNLTEDKANAIYEQMRVAYNKGITSILDNVRMISPIAEGEDYYEVLDDFYNIIHQNEESINWLHWVNEKITLNIGKECYTTLDVRVRIATSMLNKLVDKELIRLEDAILIHLNLTENLRMETWIVITEDLPF